MKVNLSHFGQNVYRCCSDECLIALKAAIFASSTTTAFLIH